MHAEYWDLYDKQRNPLNKRIRRDPDGHTRIPPGAYHIVVECLIVDKNKNLLFTQRSANVKHHAGYWECTTGSVVAGESSLPGVKREVMEETGLDVPIEKFCLLATIVTDVVIRDIYAVRLDEIDLAQVKTDNGETSAATVIPLAIFSGMIHPKWTAPDGTDMKFRGPQLSRIQHVYWALQNLIDEENGAKQKTAKIKGAEFVACDSAACQAEPKPQRKRGRPKKAKPLATEPLFEEVVL